MTKTKQIIVSILCLLSVAIGSLSSYAISLIVASHDNSFNNGDLGINVESSTEIINFALFGVDARPNDIGNPRSDSVMILTLDYKHNKIKLTSLLRDSKVYIDRVEGLHDAGYDKLTHAYYYGGPELAVKTINQNFKLDIQEYATVNFNEMASIIDAVDGIDIELTDEEAKHANGTMLETAANNGVDPQPIPGGGLQHLNGMQAVEYARIRVASTQDGASNDFGRTDRQRLVMEKLFEKALNMSATNYPNFANKILPLVTTSVDIKEILSYISILASNPSFEQMRMPDEDGYYPDEINGQSLVAYDLDEASIKIRKFIYEDDGIATELQISSIPSSNQITNNNTYNSTYQAPASTYVPPVHEDEEMNSEPNESIDEGVSSEDPVSEEPKPPQNETSEPTSPETESPPLTTSTVPENTSG